MCSYQFLVLEVLHPFCSQFLLSFFKPYFLSPETRRLLQPSGAIVNLDVWHQLFHRQGYQRSYPTLISSTMLIDLEIYLRSVSFLQPDPSPSSSVEKVRREAKEQVFLKFYFRASPSGLNISLVVFHLLSCFILFPFTLIYSFVRSPVFLPQPSRAQTTEVISLKSCHMRPDITNHKYRPDNAFEINLSITSACKGWLLPLKSSIYGYLFQHCSILSSPVCLRWTRHFGQAGFF